MTALEVADYTDALELDGGLLADESGLAGLTAAVPTCPGWLVRDLLRHETYVHDWAARHVREQLANLIDGGSEADVLSGGPPDGDLLDSYRSGHARLVRVLREADPAVRCATFLPAPSPLAFWARRQAHETAIHRYDAQAAGPTGMPDPVMAFPAAFAGDGIDELVTGFAARRRYRLRAAAGPGADAERSLAIRPEDAPGRWFARVAGGATTVGRGEAPDAACVIAGPAAGLYAFLWNRAGASQAHITITGDPEVLTLWRADVQVSWLAAGCGQTRAAGNTSAGDRESSYDKNSIILFIEDYSRRADVTSASGHTARESSRNGGAARLVRVPKAAELVTADLRRQIIRGDVAEGDALPPESELMAQFGVSRPTLREAFRVLESESLITIRRGARGGARVHPPGQEVAARYAAFTLEYRGVTLRDVYDARAAFEVPSIGRLARNRTASDLAELTAALERQEAAVDATESIRLHGDFHMLVVRLAGNQTLTLLTEMLHDIIETANTSLQPSAAETAERARRSTSKTHRRVVEYIRARDDRRAEDLWRRHLSEAEGYLLGDDVVSTVSDLA